MAPSANSVYVTPKDFGAAYDGTTNDTNAVLSAINYAKSNNGVYVYFPVGAGSAVTKSIVVPSNVKLIMDAPLVYKGTANETALQIGTKDKEVLLTQYQLNVKRSSASDWSSESSIGIQLVNLTSCNVTIIQADGFTIGVQCIGDSDSFAHNMVVLGQIMNNKIGVDCTTANSGWCNENLFLSGRFGAWSTTNTSLSRYGIRITSKDNSYVNNNNNYFLKPSFEMGASYIGSREAIPILIVNGLENEFISCRNEDNSNTFARVQNSSSNNVFDVGYGDLTIQNIDDSSKFPSSYVRDRDNRFSKEPAAFIFNSGPLHKSACLYDNSGNVNVPGVHVAKYSDSGIYKAGQLLINSNYLEISKVGLGIYVDTSAMKRFVVKKDVDSQYGGRVAVICYDGNGNVLGGSSPAYVLGESNQSPYFSSSAPGGGSSGSGGYLTGSDDSGEYYFCVNSAVKKVRIVLCGGSNSLRIRSFSVYSIDGHTTVWTGYEEIIPGVNLGIAAPASGSWNKGRLILNDNKTVLGSTSKYVIEGWECIAAPNTWIQKTSSVT